MRFSIPLLVFLTLTACQKPVGQDGRPVILTTADQLPDYVGGIVTVQGRVSSSGIPQIIGVDIALDDSSMAGSYAEATGVLYSWKVTPEAHAAMLVMDEMVMVRGPGTYYSLVSPSHLSQARPVDASPAGPLASVPPDGMTVEMMSIEIDEQPIEGTLPEDLPVD